MEHALARSDVETQRLFTQHRILLCGRCDQPFCSTDGNAQLQQPGPQAQGQRPRPQLRTVTMRGATGGEANPALLFHPGAPFGKNMPLLAVLLPKKIAITCAAAPQLRLLAVDRLSARDPEYLAVVQEQLRTRSPTLALRGLVAGLRAETQ